MVARILTLTFLVAMLITQEARCLWPQPSSMSTGSESRSISKGFSIRVPESYKHDSDMIEACQRALGRIHALSLKPYTTDRGESFTQQVKGSPKLLQLKINIKGDNEIRSHGIQWNQAGVNQSSVQFVANDDIRHQRRSSSNAASPSISSLILQPLETLDEGYSLHVPSDGGDALLEANTALGALRGLATFSQMFYRLPQDGTIFMKDLPILIEDKAAFPYRGILIDTARNYLPVESIKKAIDVMETVKLNQLHWHVTDSQSFPLKFDKHGLGILAREGAYGQDEVYDKKTVQDLVAYAAKRGVNIVPEIDMPGHMKAGIEKYGNGSLITCNGENDWSVWANEPPSGHLDIRLPAAVTFANKLVSETVKYFPGKYFSTGNDEVKPKCFGLADDDKAGTDKLLAPFVESVHKTLVSKQRTPVVWEEAILDFPETGKLLPKGTLVEAWISNSSVASILQARDDVNVLLAIVDYFYLDCGLGGWVSDSADGQSWCTFVTWQKQYSFDPYGGVQDIPNAKDRIKGGESAAWAEQIDSGNLDSVLWPRAASGAEVFWTGADFILNGKKQKRSLLQAEPRIHEVRGQIRALGVMATPLQPFWCVLHPGQCTSP